VPVHPNVLWPTAAEARDAPRGDISLALCDGCGAIWNTCFDAARLTYDAEYENSLHFSPAFRRYSDALADRLVQRHRLAGRHVAEIGSGKGEFLALLCERGACTGVGFDPSYAGEADGRADGRLTFVRELFGPSSDLGEATLVLLRHVVEHLEDPVGVLALVRGALGEREATVYVEIPAAEYLLDEQAIWDVIYPHVTCLSAPALRTVLERAGFHPGAHGYSFGGQYLWMEAGTRPAAAASPPNGGTGADVGRLAEALSSVCETWAERLPRLLDAGPVAVWGAGAKGATFVNVVEGGDRIAAVVDVNPRKHGRFVAGTGHPIVAPEWLAQAGVRTIVVMNPVYRDEIGETARALGLEADVLVA
jgi:hypothetical protein